jgi:hypothetical protein
MKTDQFLSVPENRAAARSISQQVAAALAPSEAKLSERFIEPLLDMVAKGESLTTEASEKEMGFGGADLVLLVVVPVVVAVLINLLTKLSEDSIEAIKARVKKEKEAKAFIKITVQDLELVVSRTKFAGNKKKTQELEKAINAALLDYFES